MVEEAVFKNSLQTPYSSLKFSVTENFKFSSSGRSSHYDPETGRWTTKDTIGFNGGDINLHAYVGRNPLSYIDSTGYFGLVGGSVGFISGGIGGYTTGGFWGGATGFAAVSALGISSVRGQTAVAVGSDSLTNPHTAPFHTGPVDFCRVATGKICTLNQVCGGQ